MTGSTVGDWEAFKTLVTETESSISSSEAHESNRSHLESNCWTTNHSELLGELRPKANRWMFRANDLFSQLLAEENEESPIKARMAEHRHKVEFDRGNSLVRESASG